MGEDLGVVVVVVEGMETGEPPTAPEPTALLSPLWMPCPAPQQIGDINQALEPFLRSDS